MASFWIYRSDAANSEADKGPRRQVGSGVARTERCSGPEVVWPERNVYHFRGFHNLLHL